ncbi:hypothetical protein Tco_1183053 [Tanacetum coccineum]
MSNTSDKGTTFGDGAARVGMQLRSSPKVSTSSPLVSPSTIINVPRELYSIDVAATFGVPLTTVGDLQKLINDIDAGKHDELLSELTNEDRMETLEALGSICNSIKVDRNNADVIPCKVSYADDSINLNVDESTIPSDPIVQSVDINRKNVKRVDNPLRNLNKRNHVDSSLSVKRTGFISKSVSVCKTCNECLVFGNHNKCGVKSLNYVNAKNPKVKNDATVKQVWKATGKIFASVGSKWRPTGRNFTLGDTCPLTRITKPEVVPLEQSGSVSTSEPANNVIVTPRFSKKPLTSYKRKDRKPKVISTGSPPNTV